MKRLIFCKVHIPKKVNKLSSYHETYIDIDRTWSRKNERPAESYQIGKKSCLTLRQISEFMNDHHSYTHNLSSCEIKARTHDSRDTGAVLHRLSYQAIWELVTLWVRNIPEKSEGCK